MEKSKLVLIDEVSNVQAMLDILGCRVSKLPTRYRGRPFKLHLKEKAVWNIVIEKTERQLAGWKRMYLSKGGRTMLLKNTLSNLPTAYLYFPFQWELPEV